MEEEKRQETIHAKGFDLNNAPRNFREDDLITYNKIKVGVKTVEDVILNLGSLDKLDKRRFGKMAILKALTERDYPMLRLISNYFYRVSGIYSRICNYAAQLYRYDWYITPEIYDENEKIKTEKITKDYKNLLHFLDDSYIKKVCGEIALKVIRDGVYYGYIIPSVNSILLQELPPDYCRVRYSIGNVPGIEFNMKYFDEKFPDLQYRMRVLKMFPEDFWKGYQLYKTGKLAPDFRGDVGSWYLLEPGCCVKFNLNGSDIPFFANAIGAILDLDAAQDLDRRKQMQRLLKILVQKLPLDKNGDLIFDVDEARDIHNNTVVMLANAIGVDVITTFADVESIDISDSNTQTSASDLDKVRTQVFDSFGIASNLFNSDGNLSLEKSVLNDESTLRNLLLQFQIFFDKIVRSKYTNRSKYNFRLYMLETTQYNYERMAKLYKEQVQMGYSKMLPQIALGHPQSSIINTIYFENEILKLSEVMIPPMLSSTMTGETLGLDKSKQSTSSNSSNKTEAKVSTSSGTVGRPPKEEGEKSDKTLQNLESKS